LDTLSLHDALPIWEWRGVCSKIECIFQKQRVTPSPAAAAPGAGFCLPFLLMHKDGIMAASPNDLSVYSRKPLIERMLPYLIIAPALLITIGIMYPFFTAIWYSFTNFSFLRDGYRFIGGRNWMRMLGDDEFWHAVWVMAKYAFWATGSEMVLGMCIALLICKKTNWFTSGLRVVLVFPLMIAPVIATIIWQLMTNTSVGIL
jgi:multiple sugar transport system permease protein